MTLNSTLSWGSGGLEENGFANPVYTHKNAQVVTNQETCSNAVPTTCQKHSRTGLMLSRGGAVESLPEFLWKIVMKLPEFNLISDKSARIFLIFPSICPNFHGFPKFWGASCPPPPAPCLVRLWSKGCVRTACSRSIDKLSSTDLFQQLVIVLQFNNL
jgi:hypothetical protein